MSIVPGRHESSSASHPIAQLFFGVVFIGFMAALALVGVVVLVVVVKLAWQLT